MENINKTYKRMVVSLVLLVLITVIIGAVGIAGINKEANKCEDANGKYEAVDKKWNVSTKTYVNVYDCVKK
jgi:CHASE3 domain sensor protein